MPDEKSLPPLIVTPRSGDDHLIDETGALVNLDRRRREAASAPKPADPLDHDGDGRKGGMKGFPPRKSRGATTDQAGAAASSAAAERFDA